MTGTDQSAQNPNRWSITRWLPLFTELWIFAVIAVFLVVRVLNSNTAHRLFREIGR
jgi:hypothetical protein